jgi:hypothetical protein
VPARTRISLITTMFMVVAVATACHSGSPAPPAPGLTTSAPSPLVLPTKDALDAYRAMWDAVVSAAKTADPDAPGLRRYATDKALARIVMVLYLDHEQDQVVLGTLAMAPSVDAEESTGTEIHIRDCVDTSLWLVYRASGGLVDDTPGGPHATAATVTDSGGHWMVSTLDIGEVQTC